MKNAIEIVNLTKSYGGNTVFSGLTLSIPKGKTTCIMAPSGTGKTTLLRILMGLEECDSGSVTGLQDMKKSAVFQEDRLCENLSASANIRLVRRKSVHRQEKKEREEVRKAMEAAGLSGCENQPVRELSGGMRRRVALLRALYAEWDVLFLDEPFKGLDKEMKEKIMEYTKKSCEGKTVLFVTHEEEEALRMGEIYRLGESQ